MYNLGQILSFHSLDSRSFIRVIKIVSFSMIREREDGDQEAISRQRVDAEDPGLKQSRRFGREKNPG